MQTAIAPVHPTQTPEFKAWHAGSHVTHDDGTPMVMYHGTQSDFDAFDQGKVKSRYPYSFGLHFTSRPQEANKYADDQIEEPGSKFHDPEKAVGGNVKPVYLQARNPLVIHTNQLSASMEADGNRHHIIHQLMEARNAGKPYDSVIIHRKRGDEWDGSNVIVFHPNQIKSAFNAKPTNDDRLHFSREEIGPVEFGRRPAAGQGVIDFDAPAREYVRETSFHENKRPGEFAATTKPKKDKPTTLRDSQGRVIHPTTGQVQARKGGEVSEVDGQHYKAGHWMPVHGLTQKVEPKPKAMATPGEASGGKANEDSEKARKYTEARVLSPEDLEAAKEKRESQQKWDEMNAGHLGKFKWLGESPNHRALTDIRTSLTPWHEYAEKAGPAEIKRIIGEMEPLFHRRVDAAVAASNAKGNNLPSDTAAWEKSQPEEQAKYDMQTRPRLTGQHEKKIPGSHYARQLLQHLMHNENYPTGRSNLDNLHDLHRILMGTYESEFSRKPIEPIEFARHSYSSTQFNLSDGGYSRAQGSPVDVLAKLAASIPDSELAEDGREDKKSLHITIKYGIHSENPKPIADATADFGPVTVKLGKVSIFPAGEDYDVVKVAVSGKRLHKLNALVSKSVEVTDTYPEYKPHLTLAYVRKGEGKKYVGNDIVDGMELTFDRFQFSDKDREKTTISLIGKPTEFSREEPHAKLLTLMPQVESGYENGALVACRGLRKHAGMDKSTFDKAVYHLATNGHVTPHYHDFATNLEPHELNELVDTAHGDPERVNTPANRGRYWVGIAKNRNQEFSRDWIYAPVGDGPVEFARRPYQPGNGQGSFGWSDDEQPTPVSSSNVHSFRYEPGGPGGGNLMVRYLSKDGGPGPEYRYFTGGPSTFNQMKADAEQGRSAGKFIWNKIRIRHSVSGHQMPYELAGTGPDKYIPRQAVVGIRGKNGAPSLTGEHFVPRRFQGGISPLPQAPVRKSGGSPIPGYDINKLKLPGEQTPAPAPVNTSTAPATPKPPATVNQAPQVQNPPQNPASPSQTPPPPAPPVKKTLLDRVKDLFRRFKRKPDEPKQFSRETARDIEAAYAAIFRNES